MPGLQHWSEAASGSVQISLDMTPYKRLDNKRMLPEEPATPRNRRKRVRTCLMELQVPSVAPPATGACPRLAVFSTCCCLASDMIDVFLDRRFCTHAAARGGQQRFAVAAG